MIVCLCRGVSHKAIQASIAAGHRNLQQVAKNCGAGRGCGACHSQVRSLIAELNQPNATEQPAAAEPVACCPSQAEPVR